MLSLVSYMAIENFDSWEKAKKKCLSLEGLNRRAKKKFLA